jgi:NAD(P)-dependent dehydrogenase (short-subunit alcohol dehydrogenase family)
MRLQGKIAFITGGTSGIGMATAQAFLREGARVGITGRSRSRVEAAVAQLGAGATGYEADVNDDDALTAATTALADAFGGIERDALDDVRKGIDQRLERAWRQIVLQPA